MQGEDFVKKTIFGLAFLALLTAFMIGNTMMDSNAESDEPNIYDVTGDTSVSGGMIAPVESIGIQPGEAAPDFELETLDGETIRLSELKGEKVILNFWASWCPPCREEMPEMQRFYDDYKDDIQVIAVNFNEQDDKVIEYLDEFGYTFPSPLDRGGAVGNTYGVLSLPTTYFIGTDGLIQQPRHIGPMTYEFMEEAMKQLN